MSDDNALSLGREIFAAANNRVKQETGDGLLQNAFDIASPALMHVVPAAATLIPLIRRVILPLVERALTPAEYDAVVGSIAIIERGVSEIVAAAAAERQRILSMTDAELEAYARKNGLYRETGTS